MKWLLLALALGAAAPLATWLRTRPEKLGWVCFAIGFLIFTAEYFHVYMAAVSWASWTGYSKGIEISLIDILSLAILFAGNRRETSYPFLLPMGVYFLAVVVSILYAAYPLASLFYVWQLLRVGLLYAAISTAGATYFKSIPSLLAGLALGLAFELPLTIYQRFGMGILQTPGTMEHQNQLGLSTHFVMFPIFALMLGGRRGIVLPMVILAGLVVNFLTTSRGTVALSLVGLGLTFVLSTAIRRTSRKAIVGVIGVALLVALAPIAVISFQERFVAGSADLKEDEERISFKEAASNIIADHPLGVGANQFVFVANVDGYYAQSGVVAQRVNRAGHVHNIYYLILAETGVFGLLGYLAVLAFPMWTALREGARNLHESGGDILLGCGVTLVIITIHSWEEWVMISFTLQYLLAANFGMVGAIASAYRARARSRGTARLEPRIRVRLKKPWPAVSPGEIESSRRLDA